MCLRFVLSMKFVWVYGEGWWGVLQNRIFWRQVKIRLLLPDHLCCSLCSPQCCVTLQLQERSTFLISDWLMLACVCMYVLYIRLCRLRADTLRTLGTDYVSNMWICFHQCVQICLHASPTCVYVHAQTSLNIHQTCLHNVINKVIQPK